MATDLFGNPVDDAVRNEWWDAVAEVCYGTPDDVPSQRGVIGRAANTLKAMGANGFSIRKVAAKWKKAHVDKPNYLTPMTLVKSYQKYRELIEKPRPIGGMDYEAWERYQDEHLAMLRLNGWPH